LQVLILAGGEGTRLKSVVKDIPKPLADVDGKPFIEYIFDYLLRYGIKNIIMSVGYKSEAIINLFGSCYKDLEIEYCIEDKPLGTGGALIKALPLIKENNLLVINGDTFFDVDLKELETFHLDKKADLTLSLKQMYDFDRYGRVFVDENNKITGFEEKTFCSSGLINGGVSLIRVDTMGKINLGEKFSFEKDFLENHFNDYNFYGLAQDEYFIDIGIPQDYERAKNELKRFKT
jgi:D-glycero-alpha-D-manno-heptose 1-phosphate guanylyltransferase